MHLKKVLSISALLLCFSASGTGWAADQYTMTAQELGQLETIFSQLSSKQAEQQRLLTEQKTQLETLSTQLTTSQMEIESSRKEVETLQDSLSKANRSLRASAEEQKRAHDRLERQRDTWAVAAVLALGIAFTQS